MNSNVIWHDTECGAYAADLEAWERLASESEGPILELGCGTGRVALHLARRGHEVWAVDLDAELIAALGERAAADGLPVHTERADVRQLDLGREFGLVIAAMQFIQMIGAEPERVDALRRVAAHLQPGGRLAAAILDGLPRDLWDAPAPLPDVREVDGRVYSSLPADLIARLSAALHGSEACRQHARLLNDLAETEHAESLWLLDADSLERETAAAGLEARNRIQVPPMNGYIGSVIVVAEWVR